MKRKTVWAFFAAGCLHMSTYAQPGKRTGQAPQGRPNTMVEKKKLDSLNERRSKNEVAIETVERSKNQGSGVKLDDLKNPFDTGKVRTPAVNRTGKQRRQQINN